MNDTEQMQNEIRTMRRVMQRMEKEIETYRQIAIDQRNARMGGHEAWDGSATTVDREFFDRCQRYGAKEVR
jgi:hypothetical protein